MTDVLDDDAEPQAVPLPPLPETQACGWPASYLDCSGECEVYTNWADPALAQEWFEAMAADWLWNMTNGVFGVCPVTVRPCQSDCAGASQWGSTFWGRGPGYDPSFPRLGGMGARGAASWFPVLISGQWHNITCGCVGTCSCGISGPTVISLPGPVQSVDQVVIDGTPLDPTAYTVRNQRYLVRLDGESWPRCQDMLAEPTEENTFEVTYERGIPVPVGGQVAAGRLACEFAMGMCDDENCALPERIQSITRQGLSVAMQLEGETFSDTTGIWSIDSWIAGVNRPKSFATVRSVDLPTLR